MRECHRNFAHGPMRLKTKIVSVEYRGQKIECEKIIYGCDLCDFELHEQWMEKKLETDLAEIYNEKYGS